MKKNKKLIYKISSLLLALLMLVGVFAIAPFTAGAATTTKAEKSYEIAVVFDNSGSMYLPDSTGDTRAWSRAKYAMEIFASMLDYSKDSLTVFPMWEVTTDGSTPTEAKKESTKPIEIKKQEDIDKLTKMYTIFASGTPFTPVEKAYDRLVSSSKDEKWLIVLTDGAFDSVSTVGQLQDSLLQKATNGIKVQYLGFGGAPALNANVSKGFYAPGAATLEAKLIEACNTIFQRSILPANRLNGKELNLDLSMKKLIVFVQGQGATIKSLSDAGGKPIGITLDSKQRKFSDVKYSAGNYIGKCDTDQTLYGQVVTFEACAKGKYTLDYTGSQDAVQIFYEPDVDIDVTFTNSDGEVVSDPEKFYAGEYTVNTKIVDSATKEDVTNHELMGNDVKLVTKVKTSKDSDYKEYPNGSKITFVPDDSTEVLIEGEYLGKYKISSKDDPDLAWLKGIKIPEPTPKFQINAKVLQDGKWYTIKERDKWQPIKVSMLLEGQPLTDEQLANTKLTVTEAGNLKYRTEMIPGESAYNIYIAQDESGKFVEPKVGGYTLKMNATYVDEYQKEHLSNEEKVSFDIEKYEKWKKILAIILIILLILALIAAWLFHPVLPKKIILVEEDGPYTRNANITAVPSRYDPTAVPLSGRPTVVRDMRNAWIMSIINPKRQNYILSNPRLFNVRELTVDGIQYTFDGSQMYDVDGEKVNGIKISNSDISWQETRNNRRFSGEIRINRM